MSEHWECFNGELCDYCGFAVGNVHCVARCGDMPQAIKAGHSLQLVLGALAGEPT